MKLERLLAHRTDIELTMVSEQNYLLFTPMLHEVAASDLDLTNIISPVRKMLKRTRFIESIVEKIDLPNRTITTAYGIPRRRRELKYDKLLITMGSLTHFTGSPTLRKHAVTMKSLRDAIFLRNRMIALLEDAANEPDEQRRSQQLTFVIAGGGFAGVETIGAMNDFLHEALKFYPQLERKFLKLVLVHPGKVLLPEFKEKLGHYTRDKLAGRGIDIRLETKVTDYDGNIVTVESKDKQTGQIPAFSLVWTAGVTPPPEIEELPVKKDRGRMVTNGCMEVEAFPGVWAAGDCASIPDPLTGKPFPATAQHGIREGIWAAKNIVASLDGRPQRVFKFKTLGQTRGNWAADGRGKCAGRHNFSGFPAWFFWRTVYLAKLPRFEKKGSRRAGLDPRSVFQQGHRAVHQPATGRATRTPRRRRSSPGTRRLIRRADCISRCLRRQACPPARQ